MDGSLKIKRPSTARWEFAEYILFDCYKTGYVTVTVIFQFSVAFKAFHIFFCFLNYVTKRKKNVQGKFLYTKNISDRDLLSREGVFFVAIILRPFKDYNMYASTTDCFLTSNKPIDNNQGGAQPARCSVFSAHMHSAKHTHTHMVARTQTHFLKPLSALCYLIPSLNPPLSLHEAASACEK